MKSVSDNSYRKFTILKIALRFPKSINDFLIVFMTYLIGFMTYDVYIHENINTFILLDILMQRFRQID